jgi:hypothetical protein
MLPAGPVLVLFRSQARLSVGDTNWYGAMIGDNPYISVIQQGKNTGGMDDGSQIDE